METPHRSKITATSATSKSKSDYVGEQRQVGSRKERVIATANAGRSKRTALRKEQLRDDDDVGQILQEAETGQRIERKDIADRSLIYKSYWAQGNAPIVRLLAEAPLRVGQWKNQDSSNTPSPDQGEGSSGRTPWSAFGRTPRCQRDSR